MITIKKEDSLIEFAKKHGYSSINYVGECYLGRIYEAIYSDEEEISIVGLPAFIIDKDGIFQWIQDDRSLELLSLFYKD